MKACIYQYWDGPETQGNVAGVKRMKEYAQRVGLDHVYEHNPRWIKSRGMDLGQYTPHYGAFKPVFDGRYDDYDFILFADTDVVPVDGLKEIIFEQFDGTDYEIGVCEEWNAPQTRTKHNIAGITSANDEKWAKIVEEEYCFDETQTFPRTHDNLLRIFNSGVVVYTKKGREVAQHGFRRFDEYVKLIKNNGLPPFYTCDQPYLHAMLFDVKFKWKLMDYKWNSSVHFTPGTTGHSRPVTDLRKEDTCFVHIQLRGADNFDDNKIYKVVNKPVEEW